MLDREGYRPNVGIILLNTNNEVWWGKKGTGTFLAISTGWHQVWRNTGTGHVP